MSLSDHGPFMVSADHFETLRARRDAGRFAAFGTELTGR